MRIHITNCASNQGWRCHTRDGHVVKGGRRQRAIRARTHRESGEKILTKGQRLIRAHLRPGTAIRRRERAEHAAGALCLHPIGPQQGGGGGRAIRGDAIHATRGAVFLRGHRHVL